MTRFLSCAALLPSSDYARPCLPAAGARPLSALIRALAALALVALCPALARAQSSPPAQMVEYYHTDALGSVRAVTKNGVVVSRHDFMPFGEEVEPTIPPAFKRLFTGEPRDFETGNDYLSARYYGAGTGRLTQTDPLFSGADVNPQKWNRYSYALNNPLVFTDPTGMDCIDGSALPFWKMNWGDEPLWDASGDGWGWDIELAEMFGFPAYAFLFDEEVRSSNGAGGGSSDPVHIEGSLDSSLLDFLILDWSGQGIKGERKYTGPGGHPDPLAHIQPNSKDPTKVIFRDPQTGKKIEKKVTKEIRLFVDLSASKLARS